MKMNNLDESQNNFMNYFYQTLLIPMNEIQRLHRDSLKSKDHLVIDLDQIKDVPIVDLFINWERKKELFLSGKKQAEDILLGYELESEWGWE